MTKVPYRDVSHIGNTIQQDLFDHQVDVLRRNIDDQILHSINSFPNSFPNITINNIKPAVITHDHFGNSYRFTPKVDVLDRVVHVEMVDGSVESISREDLLKYIGERKLVQENEVVRKMYERYQVAVKLARSDDNGDAGV